MIDAHAHYVGDHPETLEWMEETDLKLLNICVAGDNRGEWRGRWMEGFTRVAREHPDRFAWCTAFDLPRFDDPEYADKAIEELDRDFQAGAVACKVCKQIGLGVKDPSDKFTMIDDAIFEPVFRHMEETGKVLVAHVAEPMGCWQPLTEDNHYRQYYTKNPKWHMYGKKDYPSHGEIMAARDRLVERHPKLTFVGAHLGSLEYDVKELAKRFERFPNFAADTSGASRILDLARQDRDEVREFFIRYQDRLLFGTDTGNLKSQLEMSDEERGESVERLKNAVRTGLDYYGTDKAFTVKGREVKGIALPGEVLEKLFAANAQEWYPGL